MLTDIHAELLDLHRRVSAAVVNGALPKERHPWYSKQGAHPAEEALEALTEVQALAWMEEMEKALVGVPNSAQLLKKAKPQEVRPSDREIFEERAFRVWLTEQRQSRLASHFASKEEDGESVPGPVQAGHMACVNYCEPNETDRREWCASTARQEWLKRWSGGT